MKKTIAVLGLGKYGISLAKSMYDMGADVLVVDNDPDKLKDPAHQGLIGITNYIYEKKVPYHIHGHIHEPYHKEMLNKTKEISVFGYEMIVLNMENNI